jgi:hypothetical protein
LLVIAKKVQSADDRILNIVFDQASELVRVFFEEVPSTRALEDMETAPFSPDTAEALDIAQLALSCLVIDPTYPASPEDDEKMFERWKATATPEAVRMIEQSPRRYFPYGGRVYDYETQHPIDHSGESVQIKRDNTYSKFLRYLGVFIGWQIARLSAAQVGTNSSKAFGQIEGDAMRIVSAPSLLDLGRRPAAGFDEYEKFYQTFTEKA